jgi:hypothetical protein
VAWILDCKDPEGIRRNTVTDIWGRDEYLAKYDANLGDGQLTPVPNFK